jgi:drug/metabolite transporter (DMT)-like permease
MPRSFTPSADPTVVVAIAIGVLAVSTSGPLIAFAAAPALAIAFWRNALALPLLVPVAALRRRGELRALVGASRREGLYCALAGLALAAHLMTWVPSTKLTSVATATALVATQPVWVGLIAVALGRRLSTWTWLGIGVAVTGAISLTGADVGTSGTA